MRFYFAYLKHYVLANSRHGTHSPFVYKLADEAIYAKQNSCAADFTVADLVPRAYRNVLKPILLSLGYTALVGLDKEISESSQVARYVEAKEVQELESVVSPLKAAAVVVGGIYESPEARLQWKALQAHADVTVAIDLFFFGLLFKRAGQHKENFRLRYPAGFIARKP